MEQTFSLNVEAHRGAGIHFYENSCQAFKYALQRGYDGIEIDVWLTIEKIPIIIHGGRKGELTSNKQTNYINKMTLEEIKKIILPNNEKIPTLAELFQLINDFYKNNRKKTLKKLKVNIEIKENNEQILIKTLEVAACENYIKHINISSYYHQLSVKLFRLVKEKYNHIFHDKKINQLQRPNSANNNIQHHISFGYLIDYSLNFPDNYDLQGNWIVMYWGMAQHMTKEKISQIKKKGARFSVFFSSTDRETFNNYRSLQQLGFSKICTNYPDLLQEFIREQKQQRNLINNRQIAQNLQMKLNQVVFTKQKKQIKDDFMQNSKSKNLEHQYFQPLDMRQNSQSKIQELETYSTSSSNSTQQQQSITNDISFNIFAGC